MKTLTENLEVSKQIFSFAEFTFDAADRVLFREGQMVTLAPKACELLAVFIENAGKLMGKEDLMNRVWPDSFVEEANLTHHISTLRRALGEDKNGHKFIETIPRKGYRFIAEVNQATDPEIREIVINERDSVMLVEETVFKTGAEKDRESGGPVVLTVPPGLMATPGNPRLKKAAVMIVLLTVAAFFVWRKFTMPAPSATISDVTLTRLTPDADATAPSVSPDGASIAYVKNENGRRSLWRKTIASGETTQLTPDASIFDVGIYATRFSPDGRWIYYTQFIANEIGQTQTAEKTQTLYRIPAGGGTPQKILSGLNTDFSISPDGRQIAYIFDYRQVIVADVETGSKQILIDRDGVKRLVKNEGSVAWSPDGTRLIFPAAEIDDNRITQQLWEINLADGVERRIPTPELFTVRQIEWLPDDSGLMVVHPEKLSTEIWRVDQRTGAVKRLSGAAGDFGFLRVSADAKTLVAQQFFGQFNIWIAPADNIDKRKQITIGAAAHQGTAGLAWMSGSRIAYTSTESGAVDIWTIDEDGGNRRQLTAHAGTFNADPQPTADGRWLVYQSKRSGTNQIWRMDPDGGNPVQLSGGVENYGFSLSPENDVYYQTFLADEQKYQIYKVPVTGGEPVRIDDYYYVSLPKFSPDGKWILFLGGRTKDEKPQVRLIDRATGRLAPYFDNDFEPRGWSPDSKSIVDSMKDGHELWRQAIESREPQPIYDLSPLRIANWDFSPDGKKIALSLGNSTSEIVAIDNFSDAAK